MSGTAGAAGLSLCWLGPFWPLAALLLPSCPQLVFPGKPASDPGGGVPAQRAPVLAPVLCHSAGRG